MKLEELKETAEKFIPDNFLLNKENIGGELLRMIESKKLEINEAGDIKLSKMGDEQFRKKLSENRSLRKLTIAFWFMILTKEKPEVSSFGIVWSIMLQIEGMCGLSREDSIKEMTDFLEDFEKSKNGEL